MTLFWLLASAMALLAIAFVIVPLKKDKSAPDVATERSTVVVHRHRAAELDDEYSRGVIGADSLDAARHELKRELLREAEFNDAAPQRSSGIGWPLIGMAAMMPVAAVTLYLWFGNVSAITDDNVSGATAAERRDEMHGVEQMVARLEQRLQRTPQDAEGWVLLGRSYAYMQRYDRAASAFANASKLKPDDPRLLADYAEALAVIRNNRIDMDVMALVRRALQLDPQTPKALWLAGLERYQGGDRAAAVGIWRQLRQHLRAGSAERELLEGYIAQAGGSPEQDEAEVPPAIANASAITVSVAIDPALLGYVSPEDAVFIFARANKGPNMPLAIVRKQVRDLPLEVTLSDQQSMAPEASLSQFDMVVVSARVSKRGDARRQSGDLEGSSGPLQTDEKRVAQVRIDRVVR